MLKHSKKKVIRTEMSPTRVMAQLKMRMPNGLLPNREYEFYGIANENSFKIKRNLRYNMPRHIRISNSFSPVAVGEVSKTDKGSEISLTLRMDCFAVALAFFLEVALMFCTAVGALGCIIDGFAERSKMLIGPPLILLLLELLIACFFKIPAKRLLARLEDIFYEIS